MADRRELICTLMDTYADIIPKRQREALEYYYFDDFSLAEAAEHMGITRQGVRDAIKSGIATLMEYEDSLGLLERNNRVKATAGIIIDLAKDEKIRELALQIITELTS